MKKTNLGLSNAATLIVVTVFVIACIGLYLGLSVYMSSTPPKSARSVPTDQEILSTRPHIPQDQNAYYDLVALKTMLPQLLPEGVATYAAGSTTSPQAKKALRTAVAQYQPAFAILNQAVFKQYYFCDDKVKKEACNYSDIRNIALLNSVRAGLLFEDAKYADAMAASLDGLKLAQKLQNPSDGLVEYLLSLAIKRISLQRISAMLQSGKIPKDLIPNYLMQISLFTDNKSGQRNALKVEQLDGSTLYVNAVTSGDYKTFFSYAGINGDDAEMKQIIAEIQAVKAKSSITWDPAATYALLRQVYETEIANVDLPCGSMYASSWHPDATLDYSKPTKNIIGQLLYTTSVTDLNGLNVERCKIDDMFNKVLSTAVSN